MRALDRKEDLPLVEEPAKPIPPRSKWFDGVDQSVAEIEAAWMESEFGVTMEDGLIVIPDSWTEEQEDAFWVRVVKAREGNSVISVDIDDL